jgi:hypothetical protein
MTATGVRRRSAALVQEVLPREMIYNPRLRLASSEFATAIASEKLGHSGFSSCSMFVPPTPKNQASVLSIWFGSSAM